MPKYNFTYIFFGAVKNASLEADSFWEAWRNLKSVYAPQIFIFISCNGVEMDIVNDDDIAEIEAAAISDTP